MGQPLYLQTTTRRLIIDCSLSDAARLLGKTQRQIRYLITKGQLPAQKVDGCWVINRDDLPLSEGQEQANQAKMEGAVQIANEVLHKDRKDKTAFSVLNLKAFQVGKDLHGQVTGACDQDHPARSLLYESLMLLASGCHAFQHRNKAIYYLDAREQAARAVAALLLHAPAQESLAKDIECQYLSQLGGLIRRSESKRH